MNTAMQQLEQGMHILGSNAVCCSQHHSQLCMTDSITASVTELSDFHNWAFTATFFSDFRDVNYYNIKKNICIAYLKNSISV